MDINETLGYIHSVSWKGSRPGLERITKLMELLGNPCDSLRFVHVAGTNGKGSFCALLDRVFRAQGYKTGLFTSPFVDVFNERIRYCGENIRDSELAEATSEVKRFADEMRDKPTEFELITAIGMVYFAKKKCDIVILECGMGGRLDSTNVIKTPVLSVITGVALDHMKYLGSTVAKIAAEKAGIIKSGVPVLYGGRSLAGYKVIEVVSKQNGSKLYRTDVNATIAYGFSVEGSHVSYKAYRNLFVSLAGTYQPQNVSTVIEAVRALRDAGFDISDDAVGYGLSHTKWPARFEKLHDSPTVVFDGGHNPQGAKAIVESVKTCLGGKCVLVTGVMADKAHLEVAEILSDVAVRAFCVTPNNSRALSADSWADEFRIYGVPAIPCESVAEAVTKSMEYASKNGLPVVGAGSLYMYREFKDSITST